MSWAVGLEGDLTIHDLAHLLLAALLLSDRLSAFTREENLRDGLYSLRARPVPLQFA